MEELTEEQAPSVSAVPVEEDEFDTDTPRSETPERPQIQLSRRSEALRCAYKV